MNSSNDKCKICNGTSSVDSGASTPCGTFYMQPCETCSGTGRESHALLDWAVSLLSDATPNSKLMDERRSHEWCNGFGRWFAQTYQFLNSKSKLKQQSQEWRPENVMPKFSGITVKDFKEHLELFNIQDDAKIIVPSADGKTMSKAVALSWCAPENEVSTW